MREVDLQYSEIFDFTKNAFDDGYKIVIHNGGTGSGKTYNIMMFLLSVALNSENQVITVVSESRPHLDIGAIRILENLCKPLGLWEKSNWNISTARWTSQHTGSLIEFFSADRIDKALGARRDWLYGNEINSLKVGVWDELARRSENVIGDFNPTSQFWLENWIANYDNTKIIKSNYLNNQFLPETERKRIESRIKKDKNFRRIHFDCEYGISEGVVLSNWQQVDEMPDGNYIYGLDFGFSCFEGNTLITTLRGDIPIKNITKNDFVLTRKGYKKVRNVLNNGVKKVIGKKIGFDVGYTEIFSTFEHHFKTEKGWKQYGKLDLKDRLTLRLSSMAKNIEDIQITSKNITSAKNRLAERRNLKDCTLKFINILKEKYQKVMLFITSMGTETTMTSKICKQSQSLNTPNFIECSKILIQNLGKSIGQYMVIAKRTGMKGGKKFLKNWRTLLRFVFNVVKNLRLQTHIKSLVHQNVITNGNTKLNDSMLNLSVNSAGISLEEINISNQNAVQENVHINYLQEIGEKEVEVYDLEIEGVHEYFANGILVHNCDPTALVKVLETPEAFYIDELIYQTGMLNSQIIKRLEDLNIEKRYDEIIADSAEPKSIQEIHNAGFNIKGAVKGADSIRAGIDKLQSKPIYVTKRSINLIKELRNYCWVTDKDGRPTNKPIDDYNHLIDATRYAISPKNNFKFHIA